MKLLVTGGAGFIGSNFVRYWLQTYPDDQIINLDALTYAGHLSSTKDFASNPRYEFVAGDITDAALVNKLCRKVDVVVHFAAESHVDRSIKDPSVFLRTNVLGTQVLLDAALQSSIKRFHHVSTDEVFGALELDSETMFTEHTCYNPRSPYAASKASSDHLVRAYNSTYGLDVTITNCSNNYGPYQDPEKLLPRFITNLIDDQKVPVYGDGNYVRDWLYVEDHCRAIDVVLTKGTSGETYLVGGQKEEITNLEITKLILEIVHKDESYIEYIEDRKGHDRRYSVDYSKIEQELGWKPSADLDTWLRSTVSWYQENEWWWRPLKAESEKFYSN